jgi:hypothetical protein
MVASCLLNDARRRIIKFRGFSILVKSLNSICKCNFEDWYMRQAEVGSAVFLRPSNQRSTDENLHTAYPGATISNLGPNENRTKSDSNFTTTSGSQMHH